MTIRRIVEHNILNFEQNLCLSSEESGSLRRVNQQIAITRILAKNISWHDDLISEGSAAATDIIRVLRLNGYRLWGFHVSARFDLEMQKRFSNFSILGLPRKYGLTIKDSNREKIYSTNESVRYAGIFDVRWQEFPVLCRLQSERINIAIIISRRDILQGDRDLDAVFSASMQGREGRQKADVNWAAIAAYVCPEGDIFLRIAGAFDDRFRAFDFLYGSDKVPNPVFNVLK
jgi:hypothetical protein